MTSLNIKRILRDVMVINKDPLDDLGIYVHWNENNIFHAKACIIGPQDTPYSHGFYFFDITFPKEYPHVPPKVIYQTRDGKIRFNPNLYTCGKVCVSILNTWAGPQWTSCQSLKSVLISLQSLLNDKPIQNEPGFENEIGDKCKIYNKIISYQNVKVAIIKMMNSPGNFDIFIPKMREYYINNFKQIIRKVEQDYKNDDYSDKKIYSPIYQMEMETNYLKILENLETIFKKFTSDDSELDYEYKYLIEKNKINENKKLSLTNNNIKFKKNRKAPNYLAKKYENGKIMISQNNNKKYIVYEDKNNVKKWKLIK